MEYEQNNEYFIRSLNDGEFLNVQKVGADTKQKLVLQKQMRHPQSSVWFIYSINRGRHLLVNQLSSLAMAVIGDTTAGANPSAVAGALVGHDRPTGDLYPGICRCSWLIELDSRTGCCTIKNDFYNLYLTATNLDTTAPYTIQWPLLANGPTRRPQLWRFQVKSHLTPIPPFVRLINASEVHNLELLTSGNLSVALSAEPVLVGQVLIPGGMINEKDKRDTDVIYTLRRYAYWSCVHGPSADGFHRPIEGGILMNQEQEVEKIANLYVNAHGVFYLNCPIQLCTEAFRRDLQVEVRHQRMLQPAKFRGPWNLEIPANQLPFNDTLWYAEDRYELSACDGRRVLEFTVRNLDLGVYDRSCEVGDRWIRCIDETKEV